MKKIVFTLVGMSFFSIACCQDRWIVAGDTLGLSQHHTFNPPQHIERIGIGDPVKYYLDVNNDGLSDITIICDNSYGALGFASNYMSVRVIESNAVCYSRVDSSYCVNGYPPLYVAKLFNVNDTISGQDTFSSNEIVLDKELWFMGDTCSIWIENVGAKYLAVRLNSPGITGLAWISLDLFAKATNGFSADIKETGFTSAINSISENKLSCIVVYPVPSTGLVTIYQPYFEGILTANFFDLLGNEILSVPLVVNMTTLRMEAGTYILKIQDKNHKTMIRKVFVF